MLGRGSGLGLGGWVGVGRASALSDRIAAAGCRSTAEDAPQRIGAQKPRRASWPPGSLDRGRRHASPGPTRLRHSPAAGSPDQKGRAGRNPQGAGRRTLRRPAPLDHPADAEIRTSQALRRGRGPLPRPRFDVGITDRAPSRGLSSTSRQNRLGFSCQNGTAVPTPANFALRTTWPQERRRAPRRTPGPSARLASRNDSGVPAHFPSAPHARPKHSAPPPPYFSCENPATTTYRPAVSVAAHRDPLLVALARDSSPVAAKTGKNRLAGNHTSGTG